MRYAALSLMFCGSCFVWRDLRSDALAPDDTATAGLKDAGDGVTTTADTATPDKGDGTLTADTDDTGTEPVVPDFTLQLLHFGDIDGDDAVALSNLDELSALVEGLSADPTYGAQTLLVSAGDNLISGPRWFAAEGDDVRTVSGSNEPGHADLYILNALGVAASALGNHELDEGTGELADALSMESRGKAIYPGPRFPYLAANVDFAADDQLTPFLAAAGADVSDLTGKLTESATVTIAGETIGLVGAASPGLPSVTETGALVVRGEPSPISDLAAELQPAVDALEAAGVDKIVLLSHLRSLSLDKGLARELRHVDIIVSGGSRTRMGDAEDVLYPSDAGFDEGYPFTAADLDGHPVLVVSVDGDYKYLGRLVVGFDAQGRVLPGTIDPAVSGAVATVAGRVAALGGTPDPDVVAMRDLLEARIQETYDRVLGKTEVFLEGRRSRARTEETNLGNLVADAYRAYAERCKGVGPVLALTTGGGLRTSIGELEVVGTTVTLAPPQGLSGLLVSAGPGDITEGHLQSTLRFDDGLVVLEATGVELKALLEHAVASVDPAAPTSPGPAEFPQVSGIWLGFDPTLASGSRITDLWIDTGDADGVPDLALWNSGSMTPAANNPYDLVTTSFLANGGDKFPVEGLFENRRQLYAGRDFGDPDADGDSQPDFPVLTGCQGTPASPFVAGKQRDAVAEHLLLEHPTFPMRYRQAETPAADDRRVQNLLSRGFVAP